MGIQVAPSAVRSKVFDTVPVQINEFGTPRKKQKGETWQDSSLSKENIADVKPAGHFRFPEVKYNELARCGVDIALPAVFRS